MSTNGRERSSTGSHDTISLAWSTCSGGVKTRAAIWREKSGRRGTTPRRLRTGPIPSSSMLRDAFDAIVVGSGASGGWAAKVLTEAGLRVLMLEAGPHRVPERDFTEHVRSFEVPFRGRGDRRTLV